VTDVGTRQLLAGKTAIVTGAGRGLGKAIALRLCAAGANVAVNDIDPDTAAQTADEIRSLGGDARCVVGDIADEGSVEAMVATAVSEFGRLDLACNNALPEIRLSKLSELDVDYARSLMSVALLGTAICLKHEIAAMQDHGGAIVNISSTASVRGQRKTGFYAACKAGIEAMTRVAANENASNGLRVNAIQAGGMLTPALTEMFLRSEERRRQMSERVPLGRLADPEEVADVALFLLSDLARYVTGTVVTADGGGLLHTDGTTG
jgi:NAD(P)-dependent dehydrogenase (short-subunit alcohol dehydrogenase family)